MKKKLLTILLTVGVITAANAQVRPPAAGAAADTTRRPGSALGSGVSAQPNHTQP